MIYGGFTAVFLIGLTFLKGSTETRVGLIVLLLALAVIQMHLREVDGIERLLPRFAD